MDSFVQGDFKVIELNNSNSCHTKSKEFIEGIEEHNSLAVKLGDQVFWVAKTIKRQSIGVVRGIPENESIDDLTWYWKEMGIEVNEVRKLTPNVISISFPGPLPNSIQLPFWDRPMNVEEYIPGDRRCINCLQFGHNSKNCRSQMRCAKCGGEGHKAPECTNETPVCPHCKGDHGPTARECEINKNKKKQKNDKIKAKRNEAVFVEKQAFVSIFGDEFPPLSGENRDIHGVDTQTQTQTMQNIEEKNIQNVLSHIDKKLNAFEEKINNMFDRVFGFLGDRPELPMQPNPLNNVEEVLTSKISKLLEEKFEKLINSTMVNLTSRQSPKVQSKKR